MNKEFQRIQRLPPYILNVVNELKTKARQAGDDIIDFGMGNPDLPTPPHIVEKLIEASKRDDTHRYSASRGIPRLRRAISAWYKKKFAVEIDPDSEAIVTIGSKEGLGHLALAVLNSEDTVLVPNPAYPIHPFGCVIAGAQIAYVPITAETDFFENIKVAIEKSKSKIKMLILNFPSNPTTDCVTLDFFEKIICLAQEHKIWVVHDLAYAELVFDGYEAPSILQVKGAKDVAVEFYSLSKTYNMPGWRVGFMCGNKELVHALAKLKSYLDYGLFTPIQVAAITALEGPQDCIETTRNIYKSRRDTLCDGLTSISWQVEKPQATMFVWAKLPEKFQDIGSLEFSKLLLKEAKVACSPGIGFGEYGENHVRFSLIENEQRTRQAIRGIKSVFNNHD
jgi:alanine-synthesizing transaminase